MPSFRSTIGKIKRGLRGFIDHKTERIPDLPPGQETIGMSVKGRPLHLWKIGAGPKCVLIFAGIHGNELGTMKLAHHLVHWLQRIDTAGRRFVVIACLNPDGYLHALAHPDYLNGGREGRFNANGVDLNRNFPTKSFVSDAAWNHGKNYSQQTKVFAGESGGSEPETQALMKIIEREKPELVIAQHNAGADVLGNGDALSENLARAFADATGFRLLEHLHWDELSQTGTAAEWCAEHNIGYIEIEGRSRWASGWVEQKRGFEAILKTLS